MLGQRSMKGLAVFGIVLLLVGLFILASPLITYTTRETAVDIGPVEIATERERTVSLPQALGIVSAVAGVALIVVGRRQP